MSGKPKVEDLAASRAVFLGGPDGSLRLQWLAKIVETLGLAPDDMDLETIHGDTRGPSDWLSAAGTIPFLGDYRVVVVRHPGRANPEDIWPDSKLDKKHPFAVALRELPTTTRVIIVGDDEGGSSEKQGRATASLGAWQKLVGHGDGLIADLKPEAKEVLEAILAAFVERGKRASRQACQKLSDMVAGALGTAIAEVEKVCLFAGDRVEIREADIEAVVIPETDYNVFQLADSVTNGDARAALRQLDLLLARHPKAEDEAFPRVFPIFSRQLRMLWQARACVEAKCNPRNPTGSAAQAMLDRPNFGNEKDWLQDKMLRAARRVSFDQLSDCLRELAECDAKLKGALPAHSAKESLETMILRMAEACSGR
jgi:DNA polymerase III delta subunit